MASVTLKNLGGADLNAVLDLTFRDRELVVLTGPSGSGVSSILRMIAGLANVSQGEIFFDEHRINDVPVRGRDVALLSHDYAPYPAMSVQENLAIGLERRKFGATEIKKRIAGVGETLGLQDEFKTDTRSLSPEQQRFVGLARALVRQPKVLLFDEPFAGLTQTAASRGRAVIADLRQRSAATVLYATSDPSEALALGARTVVIANSVVQQDAEAQAIFREPANVVVAKFLGPPLMNLVKGTLKQERESLVFSETGDGTIVLPLPGLRFAGARELAGRPVVLGFPAGAVEMAAESPGERSSGGPNFRALVERAEPSGTEADLYLRTGAHELVCRSHNWRGQSEVGHRFQFNIKVDQTHLFEAASGKRVMSEP